MYLPDQTTRIDRTGLRYQSKQPGSIFGPTVGTMSCFICGVHRSRSFLRPQVNWNVVLSPEVRQGLDSELRGLLGLEARANTGVGARLLAADLGRR